MLCSFVRGRVQKRMVLGKLMRGQALCSAAREQGHALFVELVPNLACNRTVLRHVGSKFMGLTGLTSPLIACKAT